MKAFSKKAIFIAALFAGGASIATPVLACDLSEGGFLAAAAKCIAPESAPVADALDQLHGQMGSPMDQIARDHVKAAFPGLPGPVQGNGGIGGGIPVPPMGHFCYTPVGRFGPGPIAPSGTPCQVFTPYGPIFGNVGN